MILNSTWTVPLFICIKCIPFYQYPSLTVRSTTNDPEGTSHTLSFYKHIPTPGAFDICTELYNWSMDTRPILGQPFLYCNRISLISPNDVNSIIKSAAIGNGMSPVHFSSKSLRVGGAAALAPTYLIKKMGRWKSDTFLQYVKYSFEACKSASKTLTIPFLLTISYIKRQYNPSVQL